MAKIVCPNKNDPAWKNLVAHLGSETQAKVWFQRFNEQNNWTGKIPTPQEADAITRNITQQPVNTDARVSALTRGVEWLGEKIENKVVDTKTTRSLDRWLDTQVQPGLSRKLHDYYYNIADKNQGYQNEVSPFIDKYNSLSAKDKAQVTDLLLSSDIDDPQLEKLLGKSITSSTVKALQQLKDEATKVGLSVEEKLFPVALSVDAIDELKTHFNIAGQDLVTRMMEIKRKEVGRNLTRNEIGSIVRKVIFRNKTVDISSLINKNNMEDPRLSLVDSITALSSQIEKRKILGQASQHYKDTTEKITRNNARLAQLYKARDAQYTYDASGYMVVNTAKLAKIRSQILELESDNADLAQKVDVDPISTVMQDYENLSGEQRTRLTETLKVLFAPDTSPTTAQVVSTIKKTSNVLFLSQFRTALRQLQDFSNAYKEGGLKGGTKAVEAGITTRLAKVLGMDNVFIHDFSAEHPDLASLINLTPRQDAIGTAEILKKTVTGGSISRQQALSILADKAYAMVGARVTDSMGKIAIQEAALGKLKKLIQIALNEKSSKKSDKALTELWNDLSKSFEITDQKSFFNLLERLNMSGKNKDLERYLYHKIAEYQPINPMGRTLYAQRGTASLLYSLKNYSVKWLNMYYDSLKEAAKRDIHQWNGGDHTRSLATRIASTTIELGRVPFYAIAAGVIVKTMINLLRGTDEDLKTKTSKEALGLFPFSSQAIKDLAEGKLDLASFMVPLANVLETIREDVRDLLKDEVSVRNLRSLRYIPLVGDPYTYHFGRGAATEKGELRNAYREGQKAMEMVSPEVRSKINDLYYTHNEISRKAYQLGTKTDRFANPLPSTGFHASTGGQLPPPIRINGHDITPEQQKELQSYIKEGLATELPPIVAEWTDLPKSTPLSLKEEDYNMKRKQIQKAQTSVIKEAKKRFAEAHPDYETKEQTPEEISREAQEDMWMEQVLSE